MNNQGILDPRFLGQLTTNVGKAFNKIKIETAEEMYGRPYSDLSLSEKMLINQKARLIYHW